MGVAIAERRSRRRREAAAAETPRLTAPRVPGTRRPLAIAASFPIAFVAGLVGLSGAECRLPLLAGPLRQPLRHAVPLNLAVSLVTLVAAAAVRAPFHSLASLNALVPALVAVMVGAIVTVTAGASAVHRLTAARLERAVLSLLFLSGLALMSAGFLPDRVPALIPATGSMQIAAGLVLGLAIGGMSSLLGIAGGALLIPALVFAYGLDIKTAGTVSLILSLPIVAIGIAHFARFRAYPPRSLHETIVPMGAGSVLGAATGGLLAGLASASLLSVGLGMLIIGLAVRTFTQLQSRRPMPVSTPRTGMRTSDARRQQLISYPERITKRSPSP